MGAPRQITLYAHVGHTGANPETVTQDFEILINDLTVEAAFLGVAPMWNTLELSTEVMGVEDRTLAGDVTIDEYRVWTAEVKAVAGLAPESDAVVDMENTDPEEGTS